MPNYTDRQLRQLFGLHTGSAWDTWTGQSIQIDVIQKPGNQYDNQFLKFSIFDGQVQENPPEPLQALVADVSI